MLYDDSKIAVHVEGSRLLITERDTWKSLLRLFGLLPLVFGFLVLTNFPFRLLFLYVGSFSLAFLGTIALLALGISPTWVGLDMLIVRRAFTLDLHPERLDAHFLILRWKIWTTTHDLSLFARIQLDLQPRGLGGVQSLHVSAVGPEKTLSLVSFKNRAAAELFAERIAYHLQLPVQYDRPHPIPCVHPPLHPKDAPTVAGCSIFDR